MQLDGGIGGQLGDTIAITLIRLIGGGRGRGSREMRRGEERGEDQCPCLQYHVLSECQRSACIFPLLSCHYLRPISINLLRSISFFTALHLILLPLLHFLCFKKIYHSSLSHSVANPFCSLLSLFSPPWRLEDIFVSHLSPLDTYRSHKGKTSLTTFSFF